jgi:hypothetical protein
VGEGFALAPKEGEKGARDPGTITTGLRCSARYLSRAYFSHHAVWVPASHRRPRYA